MYKLISNNSAYEQKLTSFPAPVPSNISSVSHSNMFTCDFYLFVLQSIFLLHSLCIRFVLVQSIFHFFSFPTILVDLLTNNNTVNPL